MEAGFSIQPIRSKDIRQQAFKGFFTFTATSLKSGLKNGI